ncbi:alcohol dehydrogenase catalytic domain-containing protein [Streptomyces sp. NEAU-Y11]|uniref:alcohol dehydrogenase catalytic domain-containing protein n=1 Tax=Streptomyces cucumeris TaxID=2962890 RepID=UPI0020C9367F|nr:zinc-binding dehydrogenase [Streptomyces sp. NEAU-Y11]MCP9213218.1 alcohol dehydrogenase catalytic domain-containing protein [Streptomyces sp. NEAU-Y11]
MVQTEFGGPEAVFPQDLPEPVCGPRDVVVEVAYCGLNRLDLVQLKGPGLLPGFRLPHVPGMDFAGTVVATGSAVTSIVPGDRVTVDPTQGCGSCPRCSAGDRAYCVSPRVLGGNAPGALAEYVRASAQSVIQIPESVPLTAAVTVPTAFATAWHAVHTVGSLAAGETLVVHAGASAVSLAAIALAKRAGASVVAFAGSDAKQAAANTAGADLVLPNEAPDSAKTVSDFTDGAGADLVLDHVGTETWRTSLDCLGIRGRLLLMGNTSGDQVSFSLQEVFHRGLKLLGTGGYSSADFLAATSACFTDGLCLPTAARFPLEGLADAWDVLAARGTIGKVVIEP